MKSIDDGLAGGAAKQNIDRTFAFGRTAEAQRLMETGRQIGKIVVEFPGN